MAETATMDTMRTTARHGLLFATLVSLFLLVPILPRGNIGEMLLDGLYLAVVLVSLHAVRQDRRVLVAAAIAGLGFVASPSWALFEVSKTTVLVSSLSNTAFVAIVVAALGRDVYRARSVTFQTILGACSVYLLLGLLWYGVFILIEVLQPESFAFVESHQVDLEEGMRGVGSEVGAHMLQRSQLFYFTFVTMSTLGYGDIRPVSDVARVYATASAISGQLFLAILVARLVSIQSAQSATQEPTG